MDAQYSFHTKNIVFRPQILQIKELSYKIQQSIFMLLETQYNSKGHLWDSIIKAMQISVHCMTTTEKSQPNFY